ncbi:hypothetical protein H2198_003961 [Neophaeococcomyces mojaviensis]|uniref:Uncharacterized protein n=1 Tax=Neophaeococcomyces mojaviensis TaxID=3383035 RepID=A0ACC3A9V2_9EURO|nr:hypothetical protein H2198_003961 [Knufia sp. JES_112]
MGLAVSNTFLPWNVKQAHPSKSAAQGSHDLSKQAANYQTVDEEYLLVSRHCGYRTFKQPRNIALPSQIAEL